MSLRFFISTLRTVTSDELVPALNAGPDQTIDSGDNIQLAGNHAGLWTTTGTGAFDDATLPSPVYTPTVHDLALGVLTMTLTVGEAVDTVSITFNITQAYFLTLVSHFWHADDATDTAGNLTGWVDRKAGAAMSLIGTPTVTSAAINGHKTVNTDGTSSALVTPRIAIKSLSLGLKYTASGSRVLHIPSSNISTNFHAGIFIITGSNTLTVGMSGDNHRNDYYLTTPEKDADVADNVFYDYSFRDIVHFRRNMKTCYPIHETTTTDVTSTATNMFLFARRRGDNTGTTDQFAKGSLAYFIIATTAWTQDQTIIVGRFIHQEWPSLSPEDSQYMYPLAAQNRTTSALDTGHSSGGGAGNYYPPAVIRVPAATYVMAKATNNTGCLIKSVDGNTPFSEVATGKITSTATSNFNGTYAYRDGSMFSDGTTAYCWFVARNNTAVEQIGLATATVAAIESTWTNLGLKLAVATVNTALGTAYIGLGSPRCRKVGSQYYLLVSAYDATGGDIIICTMTAIDGGTITPIQKIHERNLPYHTVYASSVIHHLNRYMMITHNGWFETTRGERNMTIVATAEGGSITGPYSFRSITPLLEPRYTTSGAFDEGGTYDPEVLVENDGTGLTPVINGGLIRVFWAGVSWPVEIGLMGYCDFPEDLFEIATF